jgi:hypothetical protein
MSYTVARLTLVAAVLLSTRCLRMWIEESPTAYRFEALAQ